MTDKKYYQVKFLPEGKVLKVEDRKSIFETIQEYNPQHIELNFACGAEGICQKCKIRAFQQMGPLTPTEKGCLTNEEIERGVRLACQARVVQDITAEIIFKQPFSIDLYDEPLTCDISLNPRVRKALCKSGEPRNLCLSIAEQIMPSGSEQSKQAVADDILSRFSAILEKGSENLTAVFIDDEVLCLEEGDTRNKIYAAAVDLGTNTIVVSLIDLLSGKKIAKVTDTNPQMEMGPDLRTRMDRVSEDDMNLEIMNEEILLRLDILITELCRACRLDPLNVYEITVAGSTGMLHLLVSGVPDIMKGNEAAPSYFEAEQLEIRSSSRARVYPLPVVASYVGADIISGILATRIHKTESTVLLIDIGTDVKFVLCHHGRILASAVYGTDIFECADMTFGMRPETGAIDRVRKEETLVFEVIGESLPRGICGSGLIELAAFMKKEGILDDCGKIAESGGDAEILKRFLQVEGNSAFLLYEDTGEFNTDIYVFQKDLEALFKASARVAGMICSLENSAGVGIPDISEILISGAFGHNIDTETFKEIGLLPLSFEGKLSFFGNSSNKGAQLALIDKNVLKEAESLVRSIELLSP